MHRAYRVTPNRRQRRKDDGPSALPSVGPIHGGNFAGDMVPFQLAFRRAAIPGRERLLKLEKLIHEPKMGLDDDVESTGSDIATARTVSSRNGKGRGKEKRLTRLVEGKA